MSIFSGVSSIFKTIKRTVKNFVRSVRKDPLSLVAVGVFALAISFGVGFLAPMIGFNLGFGISYALSFGVASLAVYGQSSLFKTIGFALAVVGLYVLGFPGPESVFQMLPEAATFLLGLVPKTLGARIITVVALTLFVKGSMRAVDEGKTTIEGTFEEASNAAESAGNVVTGALEVVGDAITSVVKTATSGIIPIALTGLAAFYLFTKMTGRKEKEDAKLSGSQQAEKSSAYNGSSYQSDRGTSLQTGPTRRYTRRSIS